jgi:hypothetical protein
MLISGWEATEISHEDTKAQRNDQNFFVPFFDIFLQIAVNFSMDSFFDEIDLEIDQ